MSNNMKINETEQLLVGDDVWNRVVQIVQEGMLTGVDVTDLLRQIRVCRWESDMGSVHLTRSYMKQVKEGHERMVDESTKLKAESDSMTPLPLIIGCDESN